MSQSAPGEDAPGDVLLRPVVDDDRALQSVQLAGLLERADHTPRWQRQVKLHRHRTPRESSADAAIAR